MLWREEMLREIILSIVKLNACEIEVIIKRLWKDAHASIAICHE